MPNDLLLIRQYEHRDLEEVWDLHNKALRASNAHIGNGPWDDDVHHIHAVYIQPGGEFLVGTIDHKVVAIGGIKKMYGTVAELKRLRVDPLLERRGYGQAILTRLEQSALDLGFTEITLDTMVKQEAAQRLYKRNGYFEFRRANLGGHPCIFFRKKLK